MAVTDPCDAVDPALDAPFDLMRDSEITIEGRMPWSSNATFLVQLSCGGDVTKGIYKPGRGERPLWDFPGGLFRREIAAYELSAWLGWLVIPRTIERDGPFGPGSLQQFIDADFEQHYFTLLERDSMHDQLRVMGTFDILANNADRKGGHCLVDADGHLWGIDQGLCFHVEPKLRTVIWDFAGQPIPKPLMRDVRRLAAIDDFDELGPLCQWLEADELEMLVNRARRLTKHPLFPEPRSGHPYPWPLV